VVIVVGDVVVSVDVFVVVADGDYSDHDHGYDHDHGCGHDLPPLSRDQG